MLLVLSEAPLPSQGITRNAQELAQETEAARLLGCRVLPIPVDFSECVTAQRALAYVSPYSPPARGVWIGSIPSLERYRAVHAAARAKGIRLLNSPVQHRRALEGDRACSALGGLTPESVVVTAPDQCVRAVQQLGLPGFVQRVGQ